MSTHPTAQKQQVFHHAWDEIATYKVLPCVEAMPLDMEAGKTEIMELYETSLQISM